MKVTLIDVMGDDLSVVNAARVSFEKESSYEEKDDYGVVLDLQDKDKKLIKYLADNDHWTPFSQTAISLRIRAPIPIRTQCFKHKFGFSENETSRRYVSSTPTAFYPTWRNAAKSAKQGSGKAFTRRKQSRVRDKYIEHITRSLMLYEDMIKENVCPEQARFVLPQGVHTEWIWTGSLSAFARFCKQRLDPHAQQEIQELARMVSDTIEPLFPVSWDALVGEL